MMDGSEDLLTVCVEREFAHSAEKLWRVLTQPHLLAEWLMESDFQLALDHDFTFKGDWGSVECEIKDIELHRSLSYTWQAMGLNSVVTWTLIPTETGTLLRMEQSGFRTDQQQAYRGAKIGWTTYLARLDEVLAKVAEA